MSKGEEEKKEVYGTGSLKGGEYESEDIFAGAEPWSPIETRLIIWSFVAAAVALIIGGVLVNVFLL
jgi:hypothetical protein